jgi:5'-nucleotidase
MRKLALSFVALLALVSLGACSSNDDPSGESTSDTKTGATTESSATPTFATTTTVPPAPGLLRILVTNDDGYASDGIDTLVEALRGLPDVELTVVAPATNQSGKGDSTTEGGTLNAAPAATNSGFAATSVEGTPADSVNYALDQIFVDTPPDLVVSGSNQGQNLGVLTDISGTVGAARTAARRGIPALAVSQGLADAPDYPASVGAAIDWITTHRDQILGFAGETAEVWNINAPTCAIGTPRGVVEVPTAAESTGDEVLTDIDCTATDENPTSDVEAFKWGYISLSEVGTV